MAEAPKPTEHKDKDKHKKTLKKTDKTLKSGSTSDKKARTGSSSLKTKVSAPSLGTVKTSETTGHPQTPKPATPPVANPSSLPQKSAETPTSTPETQGRPPVQPAAKQQRPGGRPGVTSSGGGRPVAASATAQAKAQKGRAPMMMTLIGQRYTSQNLQDDNSLTAHLQCEDLEDVNKVMAVAKINTNHLVKGDQSILPLFKHFNSLLKLTSNIYSPNLVLFNFPKGIQKELEDLPAKLYEVKRLMPVGQLLANVLGKYGVSSANFALSTLDGIIIPDGHCLGNYGLGSLLKNWELNIVAKPPPTSNLGTSAAPKKEGPPAPAAEGDKKDASLLIVFDFEGAQQKLQRSLVNPTHTVQYVLDGTIERLNQIQPVNASEFEFKDFDDNVLDPSRTFQSYGFGEEHERWHIKLVRKPGLPELKPDLRTSTAPRGTINPDTALSEFVKFLSTKVEQLEAELAASKEAHALVVETNEKNTRRAGALRQHLITEQEKLKAELVEAQGETEKLKQTLATRDKELQTALENQKPAGGVLDPEALSNELAQLKFQLDREKEANQAKTAEIESLQVFKEKAGKLEEKSQSMKSAFSAEVQAKERLDKTVKELEAQVAQLVSDRSALESKLVISEANNKMLGKALEELIEDQENREAEKEDERARSERQSEESDSTDTPEEPKRGEPRPEEPIPEEPEHVEPEASKPVEPQPEEPAPEEPTPAEPEEPKPAEPQPEEPQPADSTQTEEPTPEEPKPVEPKPVEPQPEEPQPTEPQPEETKPEEPAVEEPKPAEPAPEESKPVEPQPEEPKPTEPQPEEPKPAEPAPEESKPVEPQPEEPQPEEPKSVEPAPEEPKPEEPKPAAEVNPPEAPEEPKVAQTAEEVAEAAQLKKDEGVLTQWAWKVVGVSSEATPTDWAAKNILGAPKLNTYGSHELTWAPLETCGGHEWITLKFKRKVKLTCVKILESCNPGSVYLIEVLNGDKFEAIWDREPKELPHELSLIQAYPDFKIDYLSQVVKIHLDTKNVYDEWNEIAAVQLLGVPQEGIEEDESSDEEETPKVDPNAMKKGKPPPPPPMTMNAIKGAAPATAKKPLTASKAAPSPSLFGEDLLASLTQQKSILKKTDKTEERSFQKKKEDDGQSDMLAILQKRFEAFHGIGQDLNDNWDDNDADWDDAEWDDDANDRL